MEKINLVLIGTGETARLAFEYFTYDSNFQVVGFAINHALMKADSFCGLPVTPFEQLESYYSKEHNQVFVAIGSGRLNRDRALLFSKVKDKGYTCASYVSSRAFMWRDVTTGENCFILENNVIQSGCRIGNNVTMWSGNHVGHLSRISDHCFLSSHVVISGNSSVGEYSFLGVNSAISDNIAVAENNIVGMGAVISRNTEPDCIYTGNPASKSSVSAKKFAKVRL